MNQMLGLDPVECAVYVFNHLDWRRCPALSKDGNLLCAVLVQSQIDYLHACGALDESGDTSEGEYDEDEAVEFLLDALLQAFPVPSEREALYCTLIDAFLPAMDDYLLAQGLMSL